MSEALSAQTTIQRIDRLISKIASSFRFLDENHPESESFRRFQDELGRLKAALKSAGQIYENPPDLDCLPRIGLASALDNAHKQLRFQSQVSPKVIWQRLGQRILPSFFRTKELDQTTQNIVQCCRLISLHVQLIEGFALIQTGQKPLSHVQSSMNDIQRSIIAQLRNHRITTFETQIEDSQPLCLPGTQKRPLEEIYSWTCSPGLEDIYWHVGDAGSGKSTISRTIAYLLYRREQFGGCFVFDNTKHQSRGTQNVCASLAAQLALYQPETATHIWAALNDDPDLLTRSLSVQFSRLIARCMADSIQETGNESPIYFIIDSLEQLEQKDAELIVDILSLSAHQCSALKFIITSSPKAQAILDLKASHGIQCNLKSFEVAESFDKHDVDLYLEYMCETIGRRYRNSAANTEEIPPGWPGQSSLDILKEIVDKNYAIATIVLHYVWGEGHTRPVDRLQRLLEVYRMRPHEQVSSILQSIMETASHGPVTTPSEILAEVTNSILGPIAILQDPLPTTAFASLLGFTNPVLPEALGGYQLACGSVAVPKDIVAFVPHVHQICYNSSSQTESQSLANIRTWHGQMFTNCLLVLSESMRFRSDTNSTVESLLNSESIVEYDGLHTDVSYACMYWGRHLEESGLLLAEADKVDGFLKTYLFKWAAELNLMKLPFESLKILISLRCTIPPNSHPQISSSLENAICTLVPWIDEARASPSPERLSTLIQVRRESHNGNKNGENCPGRVLLVSELRTMNAGRSIHAITVSPDTQIVACSTLDRTIQLWSVCTGALMQTLKGHKRFTTCLAFSSDRKLASGSADDTVKIWLIGTGVAEKTLRSHTSMICSVSYSSCCKLLASGSDDKTVKLWSADKGTLLHTFLEHSSHVNAVLFTPDSKYLVSGSTDCTIRTWDIFRGKATAVLEGHTGSVFSLAIDTSTDIIASGSADNTLRIWSLAKGNLMATITSHNSPVTSVRLLRKGSRVVSASDKGIIQIHSTTTMGLLYSSCGHQDGMISIAIIPELGLMVSGSYDETMKLWIIADEPNSQADHDALLSPGSSQFVENPAEVLLRETDIIETWLGNLDDIASTMEQDDTLSVTSQSTLDLAELSGMSFNERQVFFASKKRSFGYLDFAEVGIQSKIGRDMVGVDATEHKDPGPLIGEICNQLFAFRRESAGRVASEIRNQFDLWLEWLDYLKAPDSNPRANTYFAKERKTTSLLLEWWHYEENAQNSPLIDFFKRKAAGESCVSPTLPIGSYRHTMFGLWRLEMSPVKSQSQYPVDYGTARQHAAWRAGAHRLVMATLSRNASTIGEIDDAFRVKDPWMPVSLDPCPWLQRWWRGASPDAYYLWDTKTRMTIRNESNSTDYLVISHTWGRWRINGDDAQVSGVPWLVPRNSLFDVTMLPEILSQFPFETRYIWLDLVCIPQDGSPLQQQEIAKQASIFQNARWATIWFNRIENWGGIRAAIQWLSKEYLLKFADASSPTFHVEGHNLDRLADQATGWASMLQKKTDPFGYNFMHHGELKRVTPDPWFTSLWTLQEICLRPDMYLCNRKMEVLTVNATGTKAVPMDHIIALLNTLQEEAIMRESLPLAIHELAGVMALTSVSQVLEMSPIALLAHGSRRHCQDINRAPAIMSALGATEWYRVYHKRSLQDSADELEMIHDKYPLQFVREVFSRFGAVFFYSTQLGMKESVGLFSAYRFSLGWKRITDIKFGATMMPFTQDNAERTAMMSFPHVSVGVIEHQTVKHWTINPDGSVDIRKAGVLAACPQDSNKTVVIANVSARIPTGKFGGAQQEIHRKNIDLVEWLASFRPGAEKYAIWLFKAIHKNGWNHSGGILLERVYRKSDNRDFYKFGTFSLVETTDNHHPVPKIALVNLRVI